MIVVAFLKKHYEKLILGVFLLIFIGLLVHLGFLVRENKALSVAEEKNKVPLRANYEKIAKTMRAADKLVDYRKWNGKKTVALGNMAKSGAEGKKYSDYKGDFIIPEALTVCPSCRRAIPVADFKFPTKDGQYHCSLRGHVLTPPMEMVIEDKGKDTDKDGLPDDYEVAYRKLGYRFDVNDPSDAALDFDNDLFTNLEEYICDTDPLNPQLTPSKKAPGGKFAGRMPYHVLLSCLEVSRRAYTFEVRSINKESVTLRVFEMRKDSTGRTARRPRTLILRAGANFRSLDENMKVVRIENRKSEKAVLNNYVLIVKDLFSGDEIVAEKLKKVYSPFPRARLGFRENGFIPVQVKVGDTVELGNPVRGKDAYKVVKIDADSNTVELKDAAGKVVKVEQVMAVQKIVAEKRAAKEAQKLNAPKESFKVRKQ